MEISLRKQRAKMFTGYSGDHGLITLRPFGSLWKLRQNLSFVQQRFCAFHHVLVDENS